MNEEPLEGSGIIDEKIEAKTKKDKLYWKFKINGMTFNMFEYDAGTKVSTGDKVKYFYIENKGEFQGNEVTFRNLKSIFKDTEYENGDEYEHKRSIATMSVPFEPSHSGEIEHKGQDRVVSLSPVKSYENGARTGMIFNNAVQLCIEENKTRTEDIEERFIKLKNLLDKLEQR